MFKAVLFSFGWLAVLISLLLVFCLLCWFYLLGNLLLLLFAATAVFWLGVLLVCCMHWLLVFFCVDFSVCFASYLFGFAVSLVLLDWFDFFCGCCG